MGRGDEGWRRKSKEAELWVVVMRAGDERAKRRNYGSW